jgi:glutaredoxin
MMVIYSKDNCPWCDRAKELMKSKGDSFNDIKIGRDITREEFMEQFPSIRTVPYIIVNEEVKGGYDVLVSHYNSLA